MIDTWRMWIPGPPPSMMRWTVRARPNTDLGAKNGRVEVLDARCAVRGARWVQFSAMMRKDERASTLMAVSIG